jgi:hypothetical protein
MEEEEDAANAAEFGVELKYLEDYPVWLGFGAEPTNELDPRLGQHENYDVRGIVAALVVVVQSLLDK